MPRISEEAKYYIFMHETKRTMSLLEDRIKFFEKKIDIMQQAFKEMADSSNVILNKSMKRLKKFKEEIDA